MRNISALIQELEEQIQKKAPEREPKNTTTLKKRTKNNISTSRKKVKKNIIKFPKYFQKKQGNHKYSNSIENIKKKHLEPVNFKFGKFFTINDNNPFMALSRDSRLLLKFNQEFKRVVWFGKKQITPFIYVGLLAMDYNKVSIISPELLQELSVAYGLSLQDIFNHKNIIAFYKYNKYRIFDTLELLKDGSLKIKWGTDFINLIKGTSGTSNFFIPAGYLFKLHHRASYFILKNILALSYSKGMAIFSLYTLWWAFMSRSYKSEKTSNDFKIFVNALESAINDVVNSIKGINISGYEIDYKEKRVLIGYHLEDIESTIAMEAKKYKLNKNKFLHKFTSAISFLWKKSKEVFIKTLNFTFKTILKKKQTLYNAVFIFRKAFTTLLNKIREEKKGVENVI